MTLLVLLQVRNEQRFDGIVARSTDATAEIPRAHPKIIELLNNPRPSPGTNSLSETFCRHEDSAIPASEH